MLDTRTDLTITERLQKIEEANDGEKQKLVREFWEKYDDTNKFYDDEPNIKNDTQRNVTFFFKGAKKYVASDFCGILKNNDENFKLKNLPGTDIYYLTIPLRDDLRAEYILHDGNVYDDEAWANRYVLNMPKAPPQPYVPNPQEIAATEQEQLMLFKPALIAKQLTEIEHEKNKLQNEKERLIKEKILLKESINPSDTQVAHSITEKIMSLEQKIESIENKEKRLDIKKTEINDNKYKFPTSSMELGQLQLEKMKDEKRFIELDINVEGGPYKGERKCWVHLPKDYDPKREPPYPLSILLDGGQYHTSIPIPSIMDNMIEKKDIPPTVTVLISNAGEVERFSEYNCDADFTNFIADFVKELPNRLPTFQDKNGTISALRVSNHPQDISIGGSSAGGLAAVYAGLTRPDVFGKVISLSAAIWMENKEGCDLFLMSSEVDTFKTSDKNHLYLYRDKKGFFYCINGTEEKQYLDEKQGQLLKDEKFDQRGENPEKCIKPEITNAVLEETSKRGHTHKEDLPSTNAITNAIVKFPEENKGRSRFYIEVGTEEHNQIKSTKTGELYPSMLKKNQNMRDQMRDNGMLHTSSYHEFAGGHNDICWQGVMSDALIKIHNPDKILAITEDKKSSVTMVTPPQTPTPITTQVQLSSTTLMAHQLNITPSTLSTSIQKHQDDIAIQPTKAKKAAQEFSQPVEKKRATTDDSNITYGDKQPGK